MPDHSLVAGRRRPGMKSLFFNWELHATGNDADDDAFQDNVLTAALIFTTTGQTAQEHEETPRYSTCPATTPAPRRPPDKPPSAQVQPSVAPGSS